MKQEYHNCKTSRVVYVRSNSWPFEKGVRELVNDYFIVRDKSLFIIDTNAFRSVSHLIKYLEFIITIKPELMVLIVFSVGWSKSLAKCHTSFLAANSTLERWCSAVDDMNFLSPNIKDVVDVLKRKSYENLRNTPQY